MPKIAIITLGPEGAWETYVRQKLKVALELGIEAVFIPLDDADEKTLLKKIDEINHDSTFHGMIVQRPMPGSINKQTVTNAIAPEKDVDGFRSDSEFEVPVWLAVKRLLEESFSQLSVLCGRLSDSSSPISKPKNKKQIDWDRKTENREPITGLKFAVLGKGETAGGPAIRALKKLGAQLAVIDSKTQNTTEIIKSADVIITSVGKNGIINSRNIKPGAILIGVGTHVADGKLRGDYDESDIKEVAGAYTPTPGGVGPVNLSYLFENLIHAAEIQNQNTP